MLPGETNIPAFLAQVVVVSLSGVMAPGPVTAATLAAGSRNRHAGAVIALGHGAVEFPLMLVMMAGMGVLIQRPAVSAAVGLVGGAMLVWMGVGMIRESRGSLAVAPRDARRGPFMTGVLLSAGNPYFLLWWATVGLTLSLQAAQLGVVAFLLFALVHWLCDLIWLETLTLTAHKGAAFLGEYALRVALIGFGAALLVLAVRFLEDSALTFLRL